MLAVASHANVLRGSSRNLSSFAWEAMLADVS